MATNWKLVFLNHRMLRSWTSSILAG